MKHFSYQAIDRAKRKLERLQRDYLKSVGWIESSGDGFLACRWSKPMGETSLIAPDLQTAWREQGKLQS